MKKKKITLKADGRGLLDGVLDSAISRGLNRCDKYNEPPLTEGQRTTLMEEISNSFWIFLEDMGIEVK